MKITGLEEVVISEHINRKLQSMQIPEEYEMQVRKDLKTQIKREFGIRKFRELDNKYLYEAHEFIDCYTLPLCLWEQVEKIEVIE